jgi:glycosyltransferase involved in cell wall biosynthesis
MRICVVYDCLFPHTVGGAERWYRSLAERLADEGHTVTYLTLRQWDRGELPDIGPGVRVVAVGPRMSLYTADGRRRILPPLVFGLGVLGHLLRNGRRYEIVDTCAFPYFSLLAAAVLRPALGYQLIVDWFEVWSRSYWREYLGAAGPVGALVQRLCARVPQRAHCFSRLHAARLREEGLRGEVTVLRGLYTGPLTAPAAAAVEPLVLCAGRLIPEKRMGLAVAAITTAARSIEGLHGLIIGDGPERATLARAIAAEGARELIETPGFVATEAVAAEMGRAMCLLHTSSREGYGLVLVEAAALGTPSVVVAAPDNAATELIVEGVNGTVVPSADPEMIAEAITRVNEAGLGLRERTVAWFNEQSEALSLESSLRAVLASYASALS